MILLLPVFLPTNGNRLGERRAPPLPSFPSAPLAHAPLAAASASAPPGAAPLETGALRGDLPQPEDQLQPQEGVGCPANTPQPPFAPHFLISPVGSSQTAGHEGTSGSAAPRGQAGVPTDRTPTSHAVWHSVTRSGALALGLPHPMTLGLRPPSYLSQPPPRALTPAQPSRCEALQGPVSTWYPTVTVSPAAPTCPHQLRIPQDPSAPSASGVGVPHPAHPSKGCQWKGGGGVVGKGEGWIQEEGGEGHCPSHTVSPCGHVSRSLRTESRGGEGTSRGSDGLSRPEHTPHWPPRALSPGPQRCPVEPQAPHDDAPDRLWTLKCQVPCWPARAGRLAAFSLP